MSSFDFKSTSAKHLIKSGEYGVQHDFSACSLDETVTVANRSVVLFINIGISGISGMSITEKSIPITIHFCSADVLLRRDPPKLRDNPFK